jgi:hypothetical protein
MQALRNDLSTLPLPDKLARLRAELAIQLQDLARLCEQRRRASAYGAESDRSVDRIRDCILRLRFEIVNWHAPFKLSDMAHISKSV